MLQSQRAFQQPPGANYVTAAWSIDCCKMSLPVEMKIHEKSNKVPRLFYSLPLGFLVFLFSVLAFSCNIGWVAGGVEWNISFLNGLEVRGQKEEKGIKKWEQTSKEDINQLKVVERYLK